MKASPDTLHAGDGSRRCEGRASARARSINRVDVLERSTIPAEAFLHGEQRCPIRLVVTSAGVSQASAQPGGEQPGEDGQHGAAEDEETENADDDPWR